MADPQATTPESARWWRTQRSKGQHNHQCLRHGNWLHDDGSNCTLRATAMCPLCVTHVAQQRRLAVVR